MALDAGTLFPLAVVAAIAGGGRGRRRGGSGGGILSSMLQSMQQEEQQRLAHDLQTQREREGYRMQLLLPLVQEAVTKGIGVDEFKDMLAGVGIDPEQLGSMRREFFESGRSEETRNLARLLDGDAMTRYLGEDTYGGMNRWVGSDEGRDAMRRGPLVDVFLKNAQTPQGIDALGMLPEGGKGLLAALFEDPASAMAGLSGGTLASKKLDHSQKLAQIGAQKADRGGSAPAGPEDMMKYELSMWLHDNKARRASGEPELPMPEYLRPYAAKLGLVEKPQEQKAGNGFSSKERGDARGLLLGAADGFGEPGMIERARTPQDLLSEIRANFGHDRQLEQYAVSLVNNTRILPGGGENPFYGSLDGAGGGAPVTEEPQKMESQNGTQAIRERVRQGLAAGLTPEQVLREAMSTGNEALVRKVREILASDGAVQ